MHIILILIYGILVIAVQLLFVKKLKAATSGQITLIQIIQLLPLVIVAFFIDKDNQSLPWCAGIYLMSGGWMIYHLKSKKEAIKNFEKKEGTKEVFDQVADWMSNEKRYLDGPLKLSDVSAAIKVNPKLISASINDHAGENFNAYINRLRIQKAKGMLLDESYSNWTIDGIGESVGFTNKVSFYSAFKRVEDCSPSAYRENRCKQDENSKPLPHH